MESEAGGSISGSRKRLTDRPPISIRDLRFRKLSDLVRNKRFRDRAPKVGGPAYQDQAAGWSLVKAELLENLARAGANPSEPRRSGRRHSIMHPYGYCRSRKEPAHRSIL